MHQLHTRYGPVFFAVDAKGRIAVRQDSVGMPDDLVLLLIRDHIRRGGLEQEQQSSASVAESRGRFGPNSSAELSPDEVPGSFSG